MYRNGLAWLLACASFAVLGMTSLAAEKPQQIFLLIGQSNMAGRAGLEKGDDLPIPGVLLLDDKGMWEPARNPLNRYSNIRKDLSMQRLGPGYGFARKMRELDPKTTLGLVVNARGGSNINEWVPGQPLYDKTLERIKAVPGGLKFTGILWHQGESNAKDEKYEEKLHALIANLRKDLGDPELPFVAGQIYGESPVNEVFARLPQKVKHTGYASAEGLKVFDKVHFDHAGQITLGERYAEAFRKIGK